MMKYATMFENTIPEHGIDPDPAEFLPRAS